MNNTPPPAGQTDLPKNGPPELVHGEEQLAAATGISRRTLAEARAKVDAAEWGLVGGVVRMSRRGLERVLEVLGLKDAADLEDLAGATLNVEKPAARGLEVRITRKFTNRHLLEGTIVPGGEAVRLRVRDSAKFKLGMIAPVVRTEGDTLYTLARKEPRFPGRW